MLRNIVLSLMGATAAFSRTLTIDDILSFRRLQAVQISPDGSNVGYLVEEPNDELHLKDPILSRLWVVPVIRRHQWAPDSRRISDIMDGQIHVASLAGGEPRAIAHHKHDWGGKDMTGVLDGVDDMVRTGIADPNRLGISGISYGGYLTSTHDHAGHTIQNRDSRPR